MKKSKLKVTSETSLAQFVVKLGEIKNTLTSVGTVSRKEAAMIVKGVGGLTTIIGGNHVAIHRSNGEGKLVGERIGIIKMDDDSEWVETTSDLSKPVVQLVSPDGKTTFEIHAYRAGKSCKIFKGATGQFGASIGSKSAGIVYVSKNQGVSAHDGHVDDMSLWGWVQEWMQKGMDAQKTATEYLELERAAKVLQLEIGKISFIKNQNAYAAWQDLTNTLLNLAKAKGQS